MLAQHPDNESQLDWKYIVSFIFSKQQSVTAIKIVKLASFKYHKAKLQTLSRNTMIFYDFLEPLKLRKNYKTSPNMLRTQSDLAYESTAWSEVELRWNDDD